MLNEQASTPTKKDFYPASYLVMTVTSLLAAIAITGLATILVYYWINGVSNIINDIFVLYWIASVVVLAPIHLLAYWQVRKADKSQVTTFSLRFAHGLLGAYLFVTVGSIIGFSTWLAALWLNALLGTGSIDSNLWASTVSLLLSIGWLFYITRHFLRSRTNESRPKYYVVTLTSVSALLVILSLVFPAMAYKDVARDVVRSEDLALINWSISEYVDSHSALPEKLSELGDLSDDTSSRLGDYSYAAKGGTKFGIFGYTLCSTFARSNEQGRDTGFGFTSHSAGEQCFTRTTISFSQMNTDIVKYFKDDTTKLQYAIQNFLLGAKNTVNAEVSGIEAFAGGQVKQLEGNLEGLSGGMTELQKEMLRLEDNLTGLDVNTGDLAKDLAEVQQFIHNLGCLFGNCQ